MCLLLLAVECASAHRMCVCPKHSAAVCVWLVGQEQQMMMVMVKTEEEKEGEEEDTFATTVATRANERISGRPLR